MAIEDVTKAHGAVYNGFAKIGAQIGRSVQHVKDATIGWFCDSKAPDSVNVHERGGVIGALKGGAKYVAGVAEKVKACPGKVWDGVANRLANYGKNILIKAGNGMVANVVGGNSGKASGVFVKAIIAIAATAILLFLFGPVIVLLAGVSIVVAVLWLALDAVKKVKTAVTTEGAASVK